MRQRRRRAEKHECAAVQIHFREARFDEVPDVVLRHSFLEGRERGAEDIEGSVTRKAHEFKFVRGFVNAAGHRYGIGGCEFKTRRGVAKMVEKGEAGGLLDADAAGANILVC